MVGARVAPGALGAGYTGTTHLTYILTIGTTELTIVMIPVFSPDAETTPDSELVRPLTRVVDIVTVITTRTYAVVIDVMPVGGGEEVRGGPVSI